MPPPIRILFLTGALQGGGSEKVLLEHVTALRPDRFRPEVLALEPDGPQRSAYEEAGVPMLGSPLSRSAAWNVSRLLKNLFWRCRRGDIDIVHAWITLTTLVAPLVARIGGSGRVVISQRNLGYWLTPTQKPFYRWSNSRLVHHMIVNSLAVQKSLEEENLCPAHKISVIYNGVDLHRFHPTSRAAARQAVGLSRADALAIGIVGSLKKIKGQDDLLEAFQRLHHEGLPATILLAGAGPEESRLRERVGQMQGSSRVHFLGRREDVENIYNALDICVIPSRSEGLPNVILEAMACGLPVIATPVGGIPEVVEHGREGFLYPVGDAAALAGYLGTLARDPALRLRMGRAARRRAEERFSFGRMQEAFETLYTRLAR
ncbi:MAG: glycosyltransferase family 4 protein [Acidobacteriota bacterium]